MTTITGTMRWGGGVKFSGTSTFGHTITTDIAKSAGGEESGFRPTELLLYAIAGCTGVDVVRILQKQRQDLTGLEIEVTAQQSENSPAYLEAFNVIYRFTGNNLDHSKLQRAVELSESKYCSVSITLRKPVKVSTAIEIVEQIPESK
ncbi:MAG: OsmC family protein [candidate division Zixibacteria bacterium]|nr:OsmC family protein [candidate division Zixibacteria bacterium]